MAAQDEELQEMHIKLKTNAISEGKTLRNTRIRPDNLTRLGSLENRKEVQKRPVQHAYGTGHHRPGAKMPKETACERLVTYGGRVKNQAQPDLKSQAQPDLRSQVQPDSKSQAQPDYQSQAQPDSNR